MAIVKKEETLTECSPDTATASDTEVEKDGSFSSSELAIDSKDSSENVSQPDLEITVHSSSTQLETQVRTEELQCIQTEESSHASPAGSNTANESPPPTPLPGEPIDEDGNISLPSQPAKVERLFDMGLSSDSTSFLGPEESIFSQVVTSSFDFSAMQMEVSVIEHGAETPSPKIDSVKNKLIKSTARFLKQKSLTESTLHMILPTDALDRLNDTSGTCISPTKKDGHRCKRKLHHRPGEEINIPTCVTHLNPQEDWVAIYDVLNDLIKMSLCDGTHRGRAKEELEALNYRMQEWAEKGDAKQADAAQAHNLHLVEPWITAVFRNWEEKIPKIKEDLAEWRKAEPQNPSQNSPSVSAGGGTAAPSHARQKVSWQTIPESPQAENEWMRRIQSFGPYQPRKVKSLSVSCATKLELERPLTDMELRTKFLYIFWYPGNFGFIKIGVANDVSSRLNSWGNQCGHDIKEHFQQRPSIEDRGAVTHAYRVEKLVHTELKEVRHLENCLKCGGTHNEWFKTSVQHATEVIKKYSDWTSTEPYRFDERSDGFRLDPRLETRRIQELCEPVVVSKTNQLDSAPSGSSSRKLRERRKSGRDSTERRGLRSPL